MSLWTKLAFQKKLLNLVFWSLAISIFIFLMDYIIFWYSFNLNRGILPFINLLGLSLLVSGVVCALLIYWLADSRIFFKKWYFLVIFSFFFLLIILLITESSYVNQFLLYELFLLPSFFLVYTVSPNRRSIQVAIYFLTWTQFGSLLVLVAVLLLYVLTQTAYLTSVVSINSLTVKWLLYVGFSIKIPMWPFYYWLTKTHVEASSFFSIYLSGFLVKTAVYLFSMFLPFFSVSTDLSFFLILAVVGVIDSSIKMWSQIDLKKLIAYTTVQEMNLLFIPILWNNEQSEFLVSFFIITHSLLSSLFFFIIDTLLKRYSTRTTTKLTGLVHVCPKLTTFIVIAILLFSGLPFTSKFFIELMVFSYVLNYDFFITLLVIFVANWLGIIGFSKNFFNVLFGSPILFYPVLDLSKREITIFVFIITSLFLLSNISLLVF